MSTTDRQTMLQTGVAMSTTKGRTAVRGWICRVLKDGEESEQLTLGARPIVVGAHRDCDLILEDAQVSRQHAELRATAEGVHVKDLGSTNGTFWQGSRVGDVVVGSGSTVRFGNTDVYITSAETPTVKPSSKKQFGALVGTSIAMRELFAVLELISSSDATVLIEGESGTGKELVARAIHDASPRARSPFVVVDCSALSEQLLESHLFGHVRGSFTGASGDRKGAFLEANGGTVFLDEIGELPLAAQTKLLRVLEAGTVQAVGSDRPIKVDTRIVAASHRDLSSMVERKQFRFDLFYRLAVVHVKIPALRDRLDDLPILLSHFYQNRGLEAGPITGANLDRLRQHSWPGNVREFRNVLDRAWALSGPSPVPFSELNLWLRASVMGGGQKEAIDTSLPFKEAKERWVDIFEQRYLAEIFEENDRNITRASEHSGINRRHFRTLLRKHGIIES